MATIRKAPELGSNTCIKTYSDGSKQVGPCPSKSSSATGVESNKKYIFAVVGVAAGAGISHFIMKKGTMFTAGAALALGAVGYFVGSRF